MLAGVRERMAHAPEAVLRWLTASGWRSTAMFVVLTFAPILLLTYYIVATSIQNSKAEAQRGDVEARDFADVLLRTSYRSELEALSGVADEASLHRALNGTRSASLERILQRLLRRQPEFARVSLYDGGGNLLADAGAGAAAVAPAAAPARETAARRSGSGSRTGGRRAPPRAPTPRAPTPPATPPAALSQAWFRAAAGGSSYISPLQTTSRGGVLLLAVPVEGGGEEGGQASQTSASGAGSRGVLLARLPAAVARDWVRRVNSGSDRYIYLLDANHHLIAGPRNGPIAAADAGAIPGVAQALAGRSGTLDFLAPIELESQVVSYAPLPEARQAVLVVRPVRLGIYFLRVFYDKLALIAMIVFLLAVASGLLLRAAFRYYSRYTREVERGRNKTEALLTSIGDGVFAVDMGLRVIEFNPAAAALSGRRAREVMGQPYPEVLPFVDEATGEPALDLVPRAIQQRQIVRFARNLRLARPDGGRMPVAVSAAPVFDEQGGVSGCVVVFSDVSQEREVDRMKTEFISLASHQLRTPMTGVKGALSLLLDEVLGPVNPEQRQYLGRAYEANERLIALVNDLLNVSRLEQGNMQLSREAVDLGRLLSAVTAELQPRAARYRQELRLELAAEKLETNGDPMRLREVFINLVDNAIKYTPEGGRIVARAARETNATEAGNGGDMITVEVSDTGVGIAPEKLPSLFQKFARIQNPLSAREAGTGLGLYFVKSVVELHHGTIAARSEPGRGTTFTVRLPAAERRDTVRAEGTTPEEERPTAARKG